MTTIDQATHKQVSYLSDLVARHPNFQEEHNWDVWDTTEEDIVRWLNGKYGDRLQQPIGSLAELDQETASALITHLELR